MQDPPDPDSGPIWSPAFTLTQKSWRATATGFLSVLEDSTECGPKSLQGTLYQRATAGTTGHNWKRVVLHVAQIGHVYSVSTTRVGGSIMNKHECSQIMCEV